MNLINVLIAVSIPALIVFIGVQMMLIIRKLKMHKKEKALKKAGINPYGSGLCHGMVLNNEKNGVLHDQKPSSAWYSRLV